MCNEGIPMEVDSQQVLFLVFASGKWFLEVEAADLLLQPRLSSFLHGELVFS